MKVFYLTKLFLLSVSLVLSIRVCAQNPVQQNQTYISKTHNFSFEYPKSFTLKEYYPESVSISESKDFWIDAEVIDVDTWYREKLEFEPGKKIDADKIRATALDHAILSNSADGPDGSFYSNNPKIELDYFSSNGLRTIRFYLDGIYEDYEAGTKTVKPIGPFYGIDISTGKKLMVLVVCFRSESLANQAQQIIIKNITDSVKLTNK